MPDFLIDNIAEEAKVSEDNEVFVYRVLVLNENGKAVHEDWAFSDYFFADKAESITFDGFITLSKSFTVKSLCRRCSDQQKPAFENKYLT